MKTTLFLALLSVPLVLTACATNKAAATTNTAVAESSQAVVEAPASVAGKTVIISFRNAISRYREEYDGNEPWGAWSQAEDSISPITFATNNSQSKIVKNSSERITYNFSATYAKTASKAAVINYNLNDMVADGSFYVFKLEFTSPDSGIVTWINRYGCNAEEGKNATFIIK